MANIRCRAKNPSTCWKHGSGTTTTLQGAKVALESAKEERFRAKPDDLPAYIEHNDAVERLNRRVLFLSANNKEYYSAYRAGEEFQQDLYAEKVAERFKDSELTKEELKNMGTRPADALMSVMESTPKNTTLSGATIQGFSDEVMAASREKADAEAAEMKAQGYAYEVVKNDQGGEGWYYYKNDPSDRSSYAAYKELQAAHPRALAKIEREVKAEHDKKQSKILGYKKVKTSVSDKVQAMFAKKPSQTPSYEQHGKRSGFFLDEADPYYKG